jgi:hypothetical protein
MWPRENEARREKRRGRGRPRRTWEDCVIDAARRKGKTLADMKRLAGDGNAFRKWIRTRRCKATGIDEEEEEEVETWLKKQGTGERKMDLSKGK